MDVQGLGPQAPGNPGSADASGNNHVGAQEFPYGNRRVVVHIARVLELGFFLYNIKALAVVLVSMLPVIELKGGIAIGLKPQFFDGNYGHAYLWAFLGSCIVCIPLYWILVGVFKIKWFARIKNALQKKAAKINKKADAMQKSGANAKKITFWKCFWVFMFAAIPIPVLGGAWTATLVAVLVDLKFWLAMPVIFLGTAIAGGIIVLLLYLIGPSNLDIFLLVLFAVALVVLVYFLWKILKPEKPQHNVQ